jgi:hypothetical protein
MSTIRTEVVPDGVAVLLEVLVVVLPLLLEEAA